MELDNAYTETPESVKNPQGFRDMNFSKVNNDEKLDAIAEMLISLSAPIAETANKEQTKKIEQAKVNLEGVLNA